MTHFKRLIKRLSFIVLLLIGFICYLIYSNNKINITTYTLSSQKIPKDFEGYKILQLTDYHGKELLLDDNAIIEEKIRRLDPDIIVLTGDMIDSRQEDLTPTFDLLERLSHITTVYYVDGNHEKVNYERYLQLQKKIQEVGIIFLDEDIYPIEKGNTQIYLTGIKTMFTTARGLNPVEDKAYHEALSQIDSYKIMLSHIPTLDYTPVDVDLILCGHTHGGQVRLPFFGALMTNGGRLLPKFVKGLYTLDDGKQMIISSGIGDTKRLQIPRIFNPPEMVLITLEAASPQ